MFLSSERMLQDQLNFENNDIHFSWLCLVHSFVYGHLSNALIMSSSVVLSKVFPELYTVSKAKPCNVVYFQLTFPASVMYTFSFFFNSLLRFFLPVNKSLLSVGYYVTLPLYYGGRDVVTLSYSPDMDCKPVLASCSPIGRKVSRLEKIVKKKKKLWSSLREMTRTKIFWQHVWLNPILSSGTIVILRILWDKAVTI